MWVNAHVYCLTLKIIWNLDINEKTFLLALAAALINQSCLHNIITGDIVSNLQLQKEMALYQENKVRSVVIKSFETMAASEGFFCEKKISKGLQESWTIPRSDISGSSLFTSTFLTKKVRYSAQQTVLPFPFPLILILMMSPAESGYTFFCKKSSDDDFCQRDRWRAYLWIQRSGIPVKMTRIKNRTEQRCDVVPGWWTQQCSHWKGLKTGRKYYYYYDEKNRLTDVVHFHRIYH